MHGNLGMHDSSGKCDGCDTGKYDMVNTKNCGGLRMEWMDMDENLVILTKNARIGSQEKMTRLSELNDMKWDAILFTEARHNSGKFEISSGHVLIAMGSRSEASGVAILIHKRDKKVCEI